MDLYELAVGPLLWVVFLIFTLGVIVRLSFFIYEIIKSTHRERDRAGYLFYTVGRFFLPFHKGVIKRPAYALPRYLFHICLFVVPVWLTGHIVLLEESRLGWSWSSMPDWLADWMTLLLLGLTACFLIRRLAVTETRLGSSNSDYFLIILTALPFMTGYFQTNGTLDSIAFLGDHMPTIHALSGEAILLVAVFLFYRARLSAEKCTGCAACEVACPTGTLTFRDQDKQRIFSYNHYQCICCGGCVNVCPEDAAELRHEIGFGRFFQVVTQRQIRSVELRVCEKCRARFAPEPQLKKISQQIAEYHTNLCPRCRVTRYVDIVKRTSHGARFHKV